MITSRICSECEQSKPAEVFEYLIDDGDGIDILYSDTVCDTCRKEMAEFFGQQLINIVDEGEGCY